MRINTRHSKYLPRVMQQAGIPGYKQLIGKSTSPFCRKTWNLDKVIPKSISCYHFNVRNMRRLEYLVNSGNSTDIPEIPSTSPPTSPHALPRWIMLGNFHDIYRRCHLSVVRNKHHFNTKARHIAGLLCFQSPQSQSPKIEPE